MTDKRAELTHNTVSSFKREDRLRWFKKRNVKDIDGICRLKFEVGYGVNISFIRIGGNQTYEMIVIK